MQYQNKHNSKIVRAFWHGCKIGRTRYSMGLQRLACDFGADHAFAEASRKMQEHHGLYIPTTAISNITKYHAQMIEKQQKQMQIRGKAKKQIIAETDGCFIPIVTTGLDLEASERQALKIKKSSAWRKIAYNEVRVSLAHEFKSKTPYYSAIIGSTDEAGEKLSRCVARVGYDEKTKVHAVGDGARWIADQIEERFGSNGTYLIDFYHLSEYLAAAAAVCFPNDTKAWLCAQQELMKESKAPEVLLNLHGHLEHSSIPDAEAKVRVCHRYINNRLHQLNYKAALDQGLNIGSGEVESAHRYLVQKRLKIAGAAWKVENANSMLALRTCRANNDWDGYWQQAA